MPLTSDENSLLSNVQALKSDPILSRRSAARIYKVPRTTLSQRLQRRTLRRDCTPNSPKLTDSEGCNIAQYILNLDSQGVSPRLSQMEDMANQLLHQRVAY